MNSHQQQKSNFPIPVLRSNLKMESQQPGSASDLAMFEHLFCKHDTAKMGVVNANGASLCLYPALLNICKRRKPKQSTFGLFWVR